MVLQYAVSDHCRVDDCRALIVYRRNILTNMSIYHWKDYHFVGLDNYKKALLAFDSGFLPAFLRTLLWTVSSMALQLTFGFFIAVGLNAKGLKLRRVYKTLLIVPWAMPAYVSILLWRMGIFNTEFGLFNQILKQIGGKTVNFLSTTVWHLSVVWW